LKFQTLVLAAAFSALAGAALADGPAQATLQNPVAKPFNVIAGDGYWACQGSTCSSGSASDQSLTIDACRTIVKAAGPVTTYAVDGRSLPDALLAKCNGVAKAH
jgi:hypothetical protein